jgi:hypothetical protein
VPGTGDDWAAQTADTIERVVGSVRGKTSEPLERVARIVVFGLAIAIVGIAAVALLLIAFVRLLAIVPGPLWSAYLVAGGIFTLVGLLFWRMRTTKTAKV